METSERIQFGISIALQIAILAGGIYALAHARWMLAFVSLFGLLISFLPALLRQNFRMHLPAEFTLLFTLFIYATISLGEVHEFYAKFWWWDLALHSGSGLGLGFIGFLTLYTLYIDGRLSMSPILLSLFSFTFAVAAGTLWEIFEFTMDNTIGVNMQKSGLLDTMSDQILNSSGALLIAIIGYFYVKRVRIGMFNYLVERFLQKNPRLRRNG